MKKHLFILFFFCAPLPATAEVCTECHEMQTDRLFTHPPAAEGRCILCHGGADSLDAPHMDLMSADDMATAICNACHRSHIGRGSHRVNISYRTKVNNDVPDLPLIDEMMSCVTCHNPHSSDEPALLRKPYDSLCVSCHIGYLRE